MPWIGWATLSLKYIQFDIIPDLQLFILRWKISRGSNTKEKVEEKVEKGEVKFGDKEVGWDLWLKIDYKKKIEFLVEIKMYYLQVFIFLYTVIVEIFFIGICGIRNKELKR